MGRLNTFHISVIFSVLNQMFPHCTNGGLAMKLVLPVVAVLMWFVPPAFADQYSNEPENAPNKTESTDESKDAPKNDED